MSAELLDGLLFLVVCAETYALFNVSRKIETYEAWIKAYQNAVETIITNMRNIDRSGAFEADDEVGTVFQQLKSQVLILEQFTKRGEIKNGA